jgi:SecD/SecF fusion protein
MFSSFIKNHAFLYNDKKINDGLIVSNPFISTLIGIALIVLLIGIIVSILYRVPGLLYILNLISVCGLSIVLFVLTGKTISLGLTIGIITGIILLTLCFLLLMQRIKKHTMKEDFIINSLKKGFTKGVWQTIDILIVSLICGLCFLFFCGKLFADFGLSLLLFSVISIIGIGL